MRESRGSAGLRSTEDCFKTADEKGHKYVETCFAMFIHNLGYELQFYQGSHYNIKVVRQEDIAILSALLKNFPN